MRTLLLVIFVVMLQQAKASDPDSTISCKVSELGFDKFCEIIYQKSGVRVYYKSDWVIGLKVSLDEDEITVFDAVSSAIEGTQLKISVWNNSLLLLPDQQLYGKLPVFEFTVAEDPAEAESSADITQSEERYLTGRKPEVIQRITIGEPGKHSGRKPAKVQGRVLDQETGEPILYATVFVDETQTGAVTDVNGFFTLLLKPGNYNIKFDFMGYEVKKYQLNVLSDGSFSIQLKKTVYQIEEFVVYGDRQRSMKEKDPGLDKISMRSVKELPMLMGERDILKVSGTLPGIVSVGEGTSGLNVRGGGADQNAFYINSIPIFNPTHLFGFFPAFNSDIIKDFSVYKGHIPAAYGGRLSSVFNIITRRGNRKNFTAHGGISPISANLVVEGPIKKESVSVLLSARSTYSDWILQRLKDPDIRKSKAGFYDLAGGINFDNKNTQSAVFFYHSKDRFQLADITEYDYTNSGVSFTVGHNFSKTLRGEFVLSGAQYAFNTTDKQEASSAYTHDYLFGNYALKANFKQQISEKHSLNYGINFDLYKLDRGLVKPFGISSLRKQTDLGTEQGLESALYMADSWELIPRLTLNAGLRIGLFNPAGPRTVYTYTPGLPMDPRYVNDSINFATNEPIKWYFQPDFRVSLNYETDENGAVKLAFNQMHQNLFMLNNTISISPNAQWKLADYHIEPAQSNQFSAGIFRTLPKAGLEFSAELYYKTTTNYPEFKDGAAFLETAQVETTVLQGDQKAAGIELFLKRSNRRLEGWLTYTYSQSLVKIDGGKPWNSINDGKVYPANFDIPHVVNMVLNYHLSRRVSVSSIITYQTGKPITYPLSVYYVDGTPYFDYSERNAYRLPDYFRMDLSLTLEGNLKKKKLIHSSLNLSLYNLTGRENPYAAYFKAENGRVKSYQYAIIGVPIFTATWIFKIGNYASE
ncbi:MAG: TonB-dependent receptor [Bacteroidales bacterium]|jgi:hypothetical protein|nr:TonB-dependent receptor [Bacteroidales bacterium]